jgi:hypothetical protein
MRGNHTFFDLAATLIPILLLGGVVADRLRPKEQQLSAHHQWVAVALTGLTGLAVTSEVAAISAAEVGGTGFVTVTVIVALLVGLFAVSAAIVLPWITRLSDPARRVALYGSGIVVLGVFVGSFGTLKDTVDAAESNFSPVEGLNATVAGTRHFENATIAYQRAVTRAEADKRVTSNECNLLILLDNRVQFEFGNVAPGFAKAIPPGLEAQLCRKKQRLRERRG